MWFSTSFLGCNGLATFIWLIFVDHNFNLFVTASRCQHSSSIPSNETSPTESPVPPTGCYGHSYMVLGWFHSSAVFCCFHGSTHVSSFFSFSGPHFEDSFSPRRGSFSSVDYHKSLPPQPPTPPALSPLGSDVPSGILTLVHIRPVTMGLTPQRDPFARLNIFQIELTDHETNHNNMLGPLSWVFRNWLILACSCSVFPDLCPIHNWAEVDALL